MLILLYGLFGVSEISELTGLSRVKTVLATCMDDRPTRKHCTLYKFLPAVYHLHLPAIRSYSANKH